MKSYMERQVLEKKNAFLSYDDVDGRRLLNFGGIPILRTDALAVNEAAIS